MDRLQILTTAASLLSDTGENSEYDRGIGELTKDLLGINPDVADVDALLEIMRKVR